MPTHSLISPPAPLHTRGAGLWHRVPTVENQIWESGNWGRQREMGEGKERRQKGQAGIMWKSKMTSKRSKTEGMWEKIRSGGGGHCCWQGIRYRGTVRRRQWEWDAVGEQTQGGSFRSVLRFLCSQEWGSNVMDWLIITPSGAAPLTVRSEAHSPTNPHII